MKKEYQYLIGGALISAAVLLGMGSAGEEKQTGESRFRFISNDELGSRRIDGTTRSSPSLFGVMDLNSGTVNYTTEDSETLIFPYAATKAGQSNGS